MHNKTFLYRKSKTKPVLDKLSTKESNADHILRSRLQIVILILLVLDLAVTIIQFIVAQLSDKRFAPIKEPIATKEGTKDQSVSEVTHNNLAPIKEPVATKEGIKDQSVSEITRNQETPPLTLGPRRLHYQYSVVLPQTTLTLVSVLQGIVFGLLLVNTPILPTYTALSWNFLLQQYFYLPYIISATLILLIWQQFVSATLLGIWPSSLFQSALIFLMVLAEILTFRKIGFFSIWLFGLGCIGIIGGGTRLNNLRFISKGTFEPRPSLQKAAITLRKAQKRDGLLYISLGIVVVLWGLGYNQLLQYIPLMPWIVLLVLIGVLLSITITYNRSRQSYLSEIVEGSDLIVLPHGVIGYESLQNTKH